jgi:predicted PolB exonuclease-like 3'-5' exonuclease
MLEHIDISKVLFLDVECVSEKPSYDKLPDNFKELWAHKSKSILRKYDEELEEKEVADLYPERAAIFAEFGKIVCISVGIVRRDKEDKQLKVRLTSFASENEKELLYNFSQMILQHYNDPRKMYLCGHNIKEFDIPYICRRMITNQLPLPAPLQLSGKKPWETPHLLDTMDLWSFGDRKNFTSLNLLAAVLDFPTPKGDMDGSQVGRVYWEEKDLDRISFYCEKDVLATVQLFLRYRRMPILEEEQIVHVDRSER